MCVGLPCLMQVVTVGNTPDVKSAMAVAVCYGMARSLACLLLTVALLDLMQGLLVSDSVLPS